MVSSRARVGRNLGTRMNDLDRRVASADAKARTSAIDPAALDTRLSNIEDNAANASAQSIRTDGWVDLSTVVSWSSGWSYAADSVAAWAGFAARRVGPFVEFKAMNIQVAAGTFAVPVDGNNTNQTVCTGIPAAFCPTADSIGPLRHASAGRNASLFVTPSGSLVVGWVSPNATQTGDASVPTELYSGIGLYPGA